MPKFKLPKFGFKGHKVEGPHVDLNIPKADIDIKPHLKGEDVSVPKIEGEIKAPKVDI
ncbi:hypothetical protein AAFF_G00054160, partial [Aldrovandia affinis]